MTDDSSVMFSRLLALIYLIAFGSLAAQITGLVGEHGILPVGEFLRRAHEAYGTDAYRLFPTLLWLSPTDALLNVLCWSGIAASVLLLFGIAPIASALTLWVLYLSLAVAGQVFLQFQWDALLLEAGLLAVLSAPPVCDIATAHRSCFASAGSLGRCGDWRSRSPFSPEPRNS